MQSQHWRACRQTCRTRWVLNNRTFSNFWDGFFSFHTVKKSCLLTWRRIELQKGSTRLIFSFHRQYHLAELTIPNSCWLLYNIYKRTLLTQFCFCLQMAQLYNLWEFDMRSNRSNSLSSTSSTESSGSVDSAYRSAPGTPPRSALYPLPGEPEPEATSSSPTSSAPGPSVLKQALAMPPLVAQHTWFHHPMRQQQQREDLHRSVFELSRRAAHEAMKGGPPPPPPQAMIPPHPAAAAAAMMYQQQQYAAAAAMHQYMQHSLPQRGPRYVHSFIWAANIYNRTSYFYGKRSN